MTWIDAQWPFVRAHLPEPPASVIDLGCGTLGGFVPALARTGYAAVGIDPEAPDAAGYHRIPFETYDVPRPVDAVVASTSLHHVADLDDVLGRVEAALAPGGVLIVLEHGWERWDEATANWCLARVPTDGNEGWLRRHMTGWTESGQRWEDYRDGFAKAEEMHAGAEVLRALDVRFERRLYADIPYLFRDLDGVTEADEQAAIDARQVAATGIRYVGAPRGA